jgi:hypothetical protein
MQLNKKVFQTNGKEIVVSIVMLGESEGMFLPDVATALNVDSSTIRTHIRNHNLCVEIFNGQSLDDAKGQGLISNMVRSVNLITKRTVQELVAIVGTPEAKAALRYLWDIAENPATAASHYTTLGKGENLIAEVERLRAENDIAPLRLEQVTEINRLVETVLRSFNINPMVQWTYVNWATKVTKETGAKASLYIAIREAFLPPNSPVSWMCVPRKHFDDVITLINNWKPTSEDMEKFEKKGAIILSKNDIKLRRAEQDRKLSIISEQRLAANKAKAAAKSKKSKRNAQ